MRFAYVIGVLVLAWIANGFQAKAAGSGSESANFTARKDVVYARTEGHAYRLDLYIPGGKFGGTPRPVIVRLAPRREDPHDGAGEQLLGKGYALLCAGYLPDGAPPQGVYGRFPENVEAGKAVVRWVRENTSKEGLDSGRIGLWGIGPGATVAALLGVTAEQKDLNRTWGGDDGTIDSGVKAVCLFGGTTDWRNAELYGDETVNFPGSPAFELFGGNPKEHPDEARQASAMNYVRPTSPATLMVTGAADENRAMHLIYAATLQRAGVPSALYEQPAAAVGQAGRVDDSAALDKTMVEFFDDTLNRKTTNMTTTEAIDKLAAGGLYKQARRMIEEAMDEEAGNDAAAHRASWLKTLRQLGDQQEEPALQRLLEAKKKGAGLIGEKIPAGDASPRLWTLREILTDPERIGEYTVESTLSQRVYAGRAAALRQVEVLNGLVVKGDNAGTERQVRAMRDMAGRGDPDAGMVADFLKRYAELKGKNSHVWPAGVKGPAFASDFGQDLYGYWFDFKAGGVKMRMRYVPPGRFVMGSGKDEWGRLPGERILEPVEIRQGFWLGESAVTQGLYEGVMGKDENHSAFKATGDDRVNLPMDNLSYAHAVNFLDRLGIGARLPTEEEREYACRAGTDFMYSGTGRLADMGWFWDEAASSSDAEVRIMHELDTERSVAGRMTHAVKQKLPNRWGLYDMQGNVWEWCAGNSADKPRDYHAAKGGSWISIPQSCRAARVVWLPTEAESWNLGMRVCISAQ